MNQQLCMQLSRALSFTCLQTKNASCSRLSLRLIIRCSSTNSIFVTNDTALSTSTSASDYDEEYSSSYLQSRIVFNNDDVIAINKPPGLTVYGNGPNLSDSSDWDNSSPQSLVEMIPELSQQMEIPGLKIGLSLKSYCSGLVLLTKTPNSTENLRKALSGAVSQKHAFQTYLAIVVGKPQYEMGQQKELYLERQYMHDREMSVLCDNPVQSARKEGKMIQTVVKLKTISSNNKTLSSLVEVKISKDKWDAIPVILSHYLSPVLGDHIYSSRTNYLMGVPVPSLPHTAFPAPQRLPVNTENALWDHFKLDSNSLPLFLHRSKVSLPNFPSRSSTTPYEITAPPPKDFMAALKCLELLRPKHR